MKATKLTLAIAAMMVAMPLYAVSTTTTHKTSKTQDHANNEVVTTKVPDSKVIANIKANLKKDKLTSDLNIEVTSQEGKVVLEGTVNTDKEAAKAIEIAESTQGVHQVDTSKLIVKESTQAFADSFITAKIKGTYVREKLFGDKDVSVTGVGVETTDGIVYLNGTVETEDQANNAISLAKSIDGVKDVKSKIQVVKESTTDATKTDKSKMSENSSNE